MRRTLRELFRLTHARPAVAAGVRAGLAAALPLLLAGGALPLQAVSWLSLGAFQAALADRGGAYRSRARAMASVLVCSSLAALVGGVVGDAPLLAPLVAVLLLFASGLAQAGGVTAAGTGRAAAVAFLVAHARPAATFADAALQGAAVAAGALGTMALALGLWPVRLYRPARLAIARALERLAVQARLVAAGPTGDPAALARLHAQRTEVRDAIEEARRILAATRTGRQAEGERGEKLLRILENADQVLGVCVAIDGWLEGAGAAGRAQIAPALAAAEEALRAIAQRLVGVERGPLAPSHLPHPADPAALRLGARLERHLEAAVETANALDRRGPAPPAQAPALEPAATTLGLRELLAAALDRRSATLRHALRLAIAGGAATVAVDRLGVEQGYWITLTVVVVLQPWTDATLLRGLQRILGTALGGALAVAALGWAETTTGHALVVFAFCAASVALLPLSYGVFSVLLTPAFILLAELATGDYGLARVRVIDTLIGGAIALLAALLLWPRWERQRFPAELAAALRASAAWLRAQGAHGAESEAAERARRGAGIAAMNAEASLRRLISAPRAPTAGLEALLVLSLYLRRIHATALAVAAGDGDSARGREVAGAAATFLEDVAACVATGRAPDLGDELARIEALAEGGGAGLSRLARQLAIVHAAAVRAFAGGAFRRGVSGRSRSRDSRGWRRCRTRRRAPGAAPPAPGGGGPRRCSA